MDITRHSIAELANERQYDPALVETTVRLLDVLDAFASDEVVAPRMVLKGGTALNAFHLPLPRLSFDIDINYIGFADWSAMMDDKPEFESRVIAIMEAKGYRVQNAPAKGRGKWTFRCASAFGGETSLHIDFNYQARIPLFEVRRLPSVQFGEYRAKNVPVLDVHEVIGGKLNALVTRTKGRDLFDAGTVVGMHGLDWRRIKLAAMVHGMVNTNDDWRKVSSDRINGSEKDIRDSLLPCLPDGYFDAFGGIGPWLDRSVKRCRRGLAPIFEFDAKETAFLNAFLDECRLEPGLLEANAETRSAIQANPVLHRIGKALQEGRFMITSAAEKERQRADWELRLACALTERIPPSGDDGAFHRRIRLEVRDGLAAAKKTAGISKDAVDQLASTIARARAEADLRVQVTREISDIPDFEFRARFEGHPGFSRRELSERYDRVIQERMELLSRNGVVPNDLETVVARAVIASAGTRNEEMARKMEKALRFGTVHEVSEIEAGQQALLKELSKPMEPGMSDAKIKLVQRMYSCFTFVETRQICDGRGAVPECV